MSKETPDKSASWRDRLNHLGGLEGETWTQKDAIWEKLHGRLKTAPGRKRTPFWRVAAAALILGMLLVVSHRQTRRQTALEQGGRRVLKGLVQTPASAAASTDAVNAPNAVVAPYAAHAANAARAPRVADAGNVVNATYAPNAAGAPNVTCAPNATRAPNAAPAPNAVVAPDVASVPNAPATAISTISPPDNGIATLPPPAKPRKLRVVSFNELGSSPGEDADPSANPSGRHFFQTNWLNRDAYFNASSEKEHVETHLLHLNLNAKH
jgi:hypothetical protein